MKRRISTKLWAVGLSLLLLAGLTAGLVYAQTGGSITVEACVDQNADGDCDDAVDNTAPAEVEACLNDETTCEPVPATFTSLAAGSYTPFLRFVGASQGYYPTTPQTSIDLADDEEVTVTLGAVYPIHPKGVAVHEQSNKVYVAFQGPLVISGTTRAKPYPFVAVIDGDTDEVLQTIPGGPDGIGEGAWGVAAAGNYVYVGAFEGGRISVIDTVSDTVVSNIELDNFRPASPAVNPVTGAVHFPDYEGGRVVIVDQDGVIAQPLIANQFGFSPFETVVASTVESHSFVTMRDAIFEDEFDPTPFKLRNFSGNGNNLEETAIIVTGDGPRPSGPPHALGLWQPPAGEPRLFVTYADDTRLVQNPPDFINPDKLLVYSFPPTNPKDLLLRNQAVEVGDYAEVGLVFNPDAGHMLGTYAGFAYIDTDGHVAACDNEARGGTYAVNFDGNQIEGDGPGVWKFPETVVGNPAYSAGGLEWKNPFEIAVNPNNGKIYVTDRCWNDYPAGGQAGGGAVLIFQDEDTGGVTPTPTPSITPTTTPTSTLGQISLVMTGATTVAQGETFSVTVVAEDVPAPGLYGVQFEIDYDPALISAANLQVNPLFEFVVKEEADNVAGKITVVASRQGAVASLTGDVTLLTFEATAANVDDTATFTFANTKIGDAEAQAFEVIPQSYVVTIGAAATPTPTLTPTLTPTSTTVTPIPTLTPTVTPTSTVVTPTPTLTPTVTPTATTITPTPTPTSTVVTPTPTPTSTVTTPTPTSTPVPGGEATVSGQVILAGRTGNDWSGATVTLTDTLQSAVTNAGGAFTITNVVTGTHTAITADAPRYLSARCEGPVVTAPETALEPVTLLSGDLNDDDVIDITDATAVGTSFGDTGDDLAADVNGDGLVDIFDIILVSVNYEQIGPQVWTCQ